MQYADGAGEQATHADHGKSANDGKDEGVGHLARDQGEADGGHGETKPKRHHESDIAAAAGLICGWLGVTRRRVDVGHASKLPDSISVRAGHCDVARCCSFRAQIHDRTKPFSLWIVASPALPCRFFEDRPAGAQGSLRRHIGTLVNGLLGGSKASPGRSRPSCLQDGAGRTCCAGPTAGSAWWTASVDAHRKLILIRRDTPEHLIMTAGPVDLLIET